MSEMRYELTDLGRRIGGQMLAPFLDYDETRMMTVAAKAHQRLRQQGFGITRSNLRREMRTFDFGTDAERRAAVEFIEQAGLMERGLR